MSRHVRSYKHPRWSNNRLLSSHGYAKLRVGKTHPLADSKGYVYEHLVIWVSAGNDKPNKGFSIHHKNLNKLDNRIENLEVIRHKYHSRYHSSLKSRRDNGTYK